MSSYPLPQPTTAVGAPREVSEIGNRLISDCTIGLRVAVSNFGKLSVSQSGGSGGSQTQAVIGPLGGRGAPDLVVWCSYWFLPAVQMMLSMIIT